MLSFLSNICGAIPPSAAMETLAAMVTGDEIFMTLAYVDTEGRQHYHPVVLQS
ncbi:hypothetical protein DPMN_121222 [Dreissena polymorpha]|uniref:Uncharacterized protein n=1 Tax=Dreissena polymorpha TaxID=45954 RepID=A0A9D4JP92_DREPO|nr:hypothetical protein DPMN_121222 [Dreissena polymorpha]